MSDAPFLVLLVGAIARKILVRHSSELLEIRSVEDARAGTYNNLWGE